MVGCLYCVDCVGFMLIVLLFVYYTFAYSLVVFVFGSFGGLVVVCGLLLCLCFVYYSALLLM